MSESIQALVQKYGISEEDAAKLTAAPEGSKPNGFSLVVSAKKAISIYGLRRFPITLYRGEMETVLDHADEIRAFIVEHQKELATK